jgi:hypothetical protein
LTRTRKRVERLLLAVCGLAGPSTIADAQTDLTWAPETDLYPAYIADPRQPRFALRMMSMTRRDIPMTPRTRLGTAVGGRLVALRIHPRGRPERGLELSLGAGVFAQWEERGRDGIGWDGVYRVAGVWKAGANLAFKLGIHHVSSHIGDEYIENTGRRRIGYTREEVTLGASLSARLRAYGEIGYAYLMRSALQEPWRLQVGLEHEADRLPGIAPVGYFASLDAQTHQENGWERSVALRAGLRFPLRHPGQVLRAGLELYRGRSPLGEFFQARESHLALGFWLDL